MALIDLILNLAGLLLWLNWRSVRFDPLGRRTPATLIGTLRRAEPRRLRRWHLLAALGGLLLLRAVLYWQIGAGVGWAAGKLNLGIIELSFRSDSFGRILLFSIFSFGLTLGVLYLWLLLLSILAGPERLPFHRLVRMPLGGMDRWARGVKFLLPLMVTATFWWLASWLLAWLQVIPPLVSPVHRIEESLVIGLGSYLGKHPFWAYVNAEAQTLLSPLRLVPLQAGKADFAPVVGIMLVFLAAELAGRGLVLLYGKLPF
jgi:uncharacterized protein YggT (Ycf19 family)